MTSVGRVTRQVAERLERDLGLRFDGAGLRRLERGLHAAATAAGRSVDAHAGRLAHDREARQQLVDLVTVQETSWFRDPPVFAALAGTVLPAAADRARAQGRPVRVWSAGCAHGQEPWSLTMLAAEQGVPLNVVATDVSRPALARAAAGVYHERELRGLSAARRRRWLTPLDATHSRVRDDLRATVRFTSHDLVADPPPAASADVVLCRYVLIYLAPDAARAVLDVIAQVLGAEGRLFVGGAESLWHLTDRFEADRIGEAFVYRPVVAGDRAPAPPKEPPAQNGGPPREPRPAAPAMPLPERDALLAQGEAAVSAGDLAAAVTAFRGAAYIDPDAAVAHLQLGLALEQLGDPGALRAFRAAWAALSRTGGDGLPDQLDGWRTEELVRLVGTKLGAIR